MNKLIYIILIVYSYIGKASSVEDKSLNVETLISEQIGNLLKGVVAKNQYSVTVDVELLVNKKKKIIMGETESIKTNTSQKEDTKNLPGFGLSGEESLQEASPENTVQRKEQYVYEDVFAVDNVFVQLVLDSKIEEEKKELIKEIVTDRMKKKYGYKARVITKEIDFIGTGLSADRTSVVKSMIQENFELFLFFIIIFIILLFIILKTKIGVSSKAAKATEEKSIEVLSDRNHKEAKAQQPPIQVNVYDKIIDHLKKSPLISRAYLKSMSTENKLAIIESVETEAIKTSLFNLLELKVEDKAVGGMNEETLIEKTNDILNQLNKSQHTQSLIFEQRFGYITLLKPKEIYKLLMDLTAEEIAIVIRHVHESNYSYIIKKLTQSIRVEVVKHLSKQENIDIEIEKKIDSKLRHKILDFYSDFLSIDAEQNVVIDKFLENDPNIEETMNSLKNDSSFKFKEEYNVLLIPFEEAIHKLEESYMAMKELENNEVAILIQDLKKDMQNKLLKKFTEIRSGLIKNFLTSLVFSEVDLDLVKKKFMKIFREQVRRSGHG